MKKLFIFFSSIFLSCLFIYFTGKLFFVNFQEQDVFYTQDEIEDLKEVNFKFTGKISQLFFYNEFEGHVKISEMNCVNKDLNLNIFVQIKGFLDIRLVNGQALINNSKGTYKYQVNYDDLCEVIYATLENSKNNKIFQEEYTNIFYYSDSNREIILRKVIISKKNNYLLVKAEVRIDKKSYFISILKK